jgi:hypothetical protein
MPDYQQLVDDIRSFLHSNDHALTESVKELAIAYTDACQDVNQRLRRCTDFLQQGLRSEAIQLAQAKPMLLDQLAVLDFPERSEWADVTSMYDLPAPPRLNLEGAELLNEAYAAMLPLDGLLREHRRLALTRAPLGTRLKVMRRIAELDSANPFWNDDISEFEKARFGEIEGEIKRAVKEDDSALIDTLHEELEKTIWVAEKPSQLSRYVETAATRSFENTMRERLGRLLELLANAFAAKDVEDGRRLREQWDEAMSSVEIPLEDPLWERASPVLDWLSREDRRAAAAQKFQAAVGVLEEGLDAGLEREGLERDYEALRAYRLPIPPETQKRYQRYIAGLDRAIRRKRQMIGGGIAAGALLLLAVITFWVQQAQRAARAEEASTALTKLIVQGNYVEARAQLDLLAQNDPAVATTAEVCTAQARLEECEDKERQRLQGLRRLMREIEGAALDTPEGELFSRAQGLSRLPEEKKAVEQLRLERRESLRRSQMEHEVAFSPRLEGMLQNARKAEEVQEAGADISALSQLVGDMERELPGFLEAAKGVTEDKRRAAVELGEQVRNMRKKLDQQIEDARLCERMTSALSGDPKISAYVEAIDTYVAAFSNTSRGGQFSVAAGEKALWQDVVEWNRLLSPVIGKPYGIEPDKAKKLAEDLTAFCTAHAQFADLPTAESYRACVEAIAQRDEGKVSSAAAQLRKYFENRLLTGLSFVELKNGEIYYTHDDPRALIEAAKVEVGQRPAAQFHFLGGFDEKQVKNKRVLVDDIERTGRAPQSIIAAIVKGTPTRSAQSWESRTVDLAEKLRTIKDMDAILQLTLLKRVVDFAGRGSRPLELALDKYREKLQGSGVDLSVRWLDPQDKLAPRMREKARVFLGTVPELRSVLEEARQRQAEMEKAVIRSFTTVCGWLARDHGRWQCRSALKQAPVNCELCVIVPKGATAQYVVVGRTSAGKLEVNNVGQGLVEGRLVFARNLDSH